MKCLMPTFSWRGPHTFHIVPGLLCKARPHCDPWFGKICAPVTPLTIPERWIWRLFVFEGLIFFSAVVQCKHVYWEKQKRKCGCLEVLRVPLFQERLEKSLYWCIYCNCTSCFLILLLCRHLPLCLLLFTPPTLSLYPPTLLSHHLSPPSSPVCLCYVLVYSGWVTLSDVRQFSCEEVRAQLVLVLWFVGNKITTYCRLTMTLIPSLKMFPQWKFSFDQHSVCPPNSSLFVRFRICIVNPLSPSRVQLGYILRAYGNI